MDISLSDISHTKTSRTKVRPVDVAVVGLGYVGLPLALLCEKKGLSVLGIDSDARKRSALIRRTASFLGESEHNELKKRGLRIEGYGEALAEAEMIIICVPTPVHENHAPDLAPLRSAVREVGVRLRPGQTVIVESTVNPGVCERVVLPALERLSGLTADNDFFFAHAPERINPGDPRWSVENIPRVVGARTKESLERAVRFYRSILGAAVHTMETLREAEAVKIVENSFRDVNIAFVNELAMSFEKLGIDVVNVIKGASTKPFGYMPFYPGCGVGGHCIPVDPYYLISYARQNGYHHRFLSLARTINNRMPHFTVKLLLSALKEGGIPARRGLTVSLLGLAYKRGVGDTRESPALKIRDLLLRRGFSVQAYDPYVPGAGAAKNLSGALEGAAAAVIATDHAEFAELRPEFFAAQGIAVVIDGRNCLDKKAFAGSTVLYRGVGRAPLPDSEEERPSPSTSLS